LSVVVCRTCSTEWAATVRPWCPNCLLEKWAASPNLITEKHAPETARETRDDYRSVVSKDVVRNLRAFLSDAVTSGTWYFHAEFEKYNHVTRLPRGQKPGSGVSSGNARPDRRLDDFVIADADFDPHIFVDDRDETRRKLTTGIYRPLESCSRAKCDNLSQPRVRKCVIHADPPLAFKSRS
jgi:hypothetical protein